jgi:hypothetical protein
MRTLVPRDLADAQVTTLYASSVRNVALRDANMDGRSARETAALFARLWMNAELIIVSPE